MVRFVAEPMAVLVPLAVAAFARSSTAPASFTATSMPRQLAVVMTAEAKALLLSPFPPASIPDGYTRSPHARDDSAERGERAVFSDKLGRTSVAGTLTIYERTIKSLQRAVAEMLGDQCARRSIS
ncbi:hypothetical protein C5C18_14500 [Rathayibacter tritici]|uniref:hypothetical protein n=1 Tax=Rathayibacter tritici TaxID=33888 RepID=UPI000CE81E77|nr:hypothetical protein [Rathayibacter tritici]PPF23884.1 hypothetical protein C5C06_13575 [Rathayibacter tritici]PPF62533.1 hypothetical protein C5C21_14105 [Rathayibacter tritici]PPG03720.1 hypothetical protein C5C18_14500 [Rathayibacter tritici]PPI11386.1 hypothetical protein C5D07_14315 [Rathayibacter tritici]